MWDGLPPPSHPDGILTTYALLTPSGTLREAADSTSLAYEPGPRRADDCAALRLQRPMRYALSIWQLVVGSRFTLRPHPSGIRFRGRACSS